MGVNSCCCCLRLQGDLNFQIRLICWEWDWPVALLWQAGHLSSKLHVLLHVILQHRYRRVQVLLEVTTALSARYPCSKHAVKYTTSNTLRGQWLTLYSWIQMIPALHPLRLFSQHRGHMAPFTTTGTNPLVASQTCILCFSSRKDKHIVVQGFGKAHQSC